MSFYLHFFKDLLCDVVRYVAMQLDMQLFLFKNKLACIMRPCTKSCSREHVLLAFPHPPVVSFTGHVCQECLNIGSYLTLDISTASKYSACPRFLYINVAWQLQLNNYQLHVFFRPAPSLLVWRLNQLIYSHMQNIRELRVNY